MTGLQTRQLVWTDVHRVNAAASTLNNGMGVVTAYMLNNPTQLTQADVSSGTTYANANQGLVAPLTALDDNRITLRNSLMKIYINNVSNVHAYIRITKCRFRKNVSLAQFPNIINLLGALATGTNAGINPAAPPPGNGFPCTPIADLTTGTVFRQNCKILSSKIKLVPAGRSITTTTKRNYYGRFATGQDAGNTSYLGTPFTSFIILHSWSVPTQTTVSNVAINRSTFTNYDLAIVGHQILRYNLLEDNDPSTGVNFTNWGDAGPARVMTEVSELATDDVTDA